MKKEEKKKNVCAICKIPLKGKRVFGLCPEHFKKKEGFSTSKNFIERRFYGVWEHLRMRCYSRNNPAYPNYGGRGIICEWEKFEDFKNDMYPSYIEHKLKHTYTAIDRIDNDGNYSKENCRWVTHKENIRNTRWVKWTYTLTEFCEATGLNAGSVRSAMKRGCTLDEVLGNLIKIKINDEVKKKLDRAVREREEKIKDIDFAQVHFYLEDEAEKWKGKPEDFDIYELTNKWCEEQISQLTDSEK